MMALKNVISFSENLLNCAKWSLNLKSDIARNTAVLSSDKIDLPLPPKKPPTAYLIFCKQNRSSVTKQNPALSGTDLIKVLAEKWSGLSPILKKPYEESARESTIIYGKLHKEYYEKLTKEQRAALQIEKEEKKKAKKIMKLKKALKESGIPPSPSNPYALFVKSRAKEVGTISSGITFIKQVAEYWKTLPESEKKIFRERAMEEKQRYRNDIGNWREKLLNEGQESLLKSYEESKSKFQGTDIQEKMTPVSKKSSLKRQKSAESKESTLEN